MSQQFRISTTSHFKRDARKALIRDPKLDITLLHLRAILQEDPYNLTRQHDIKKLEGVKEGEGQWRIRSGRYRLRYDIIDNDVVLYSFSHRREAY